MSSWTTQGAPRRRDVTRIPEPFRPVLTSRAEHPFVVLSETFQTTQESFDRVMPTVSHASSHASSRVLSPPPPPSRAVELRHQGESFVFVIIRHLRSNADNALWISSYQSIREHYTNPIVIIDDGSTINTVNGKLVNTEVISSEYSGAGELLPYYYFWKNKWADRMVFLHDSMFLARPFRPEELEGDMRFLWHFTEPVDRKLEMYLTMLPEGHALWEAAQGSWQGCFGAASIVSLQVVEQLEARYEVLSRLIITLRSRADRKMFERILGLLASLEGHGESLFGDIRKYPDAFETQAQTVAAAQRLAAGYNTAVWKVWKGR